MSDNSLSETGKSLSEGDMKSMALIEAETWAGVLMDAEFKGRGDREKSARGRLADRLKIQESQLFRLQYKAREMSDVAGSISRALMLGYEELCARNEAAAERSRATRQELRTNNEATPKPGEPVLAMGSPED